jgi:hypothetical protein
MRPPPATLLTAIMRVRGVRGACSPAVRRACCAFVTAMIALLATGCGAGVKAADLFVVERSGTTPDARVTLLVNEEGGLRCNGGSERKLSDPQIIQARAIQEELKELAEQHLYLPARPGSVLSYRVRDENGSVRYADNSGGQPKVLRNLALFVLQVAQSVCRLPQQSA